MKDKNSIRDWWANNPMTYGDTHGRTDYGKDSLTMGTQPFFERMDREFFGWNKPLHGKKPFDRLFPYERYGEGKKVLEIGCGLGTMAMLWALNGANITAIDLNPTSIEQARQRFALYNLAGDIHAEDANNLSLADGQFDYVYSWGVLHHSPNLEQSLAEMMRVLKPGGEYGIMLYNRNSLLYGYMIRYLEGFLHYENKFLDPLALASRYSDGYKEEGNPHTWPVRMNEVKGMLSAHSSDPEGRILGTDLDYLFKLIVPGLGSILPAWAKKPWARRWGWSIWIQGHKK